MGRSDSPDPALERLRSAPIADVAAELFAATFRAQTKTPLSFRDIHKNLARLAGLSKPSLLTARQTVDFVIALECTILWEQALLATRMWAGDSAALHVHLLRRGEAVRSSTDPLGKARTALSDIDIPPIP